MRLRKPGWRDPRLLIGLILLTLGIGVGSAVVNAASNTVPVYVAATTLTQGTPLTPGNLVTVDVRIPDHEDHYLTPAYANDEWWQAQPRIARTIAAGELVPLAAVTNDVDLQLRPVMFPLPAGSHDTVVVGTVVDLWHVSETNSETEPHLLATALTVSHIGEEAGPLALSGGQVATVLVPVADLKTVLNAKSSAGSVELVPHLSGGTS